MTKFCPGCTTDKPTSDFNKKTANKDGLAHRCRECRKKYRNKPSNAYPIVAPPKLIFKLTNKIVCSPLQVNAGICHQKTRRDATESEDREQGFKFDLKVSDFIFNNERMTREHISFIERYEWLGKIGWAVKWCFTARHDGKLAGVVLMSEPTMATKYKVYEALIQRGAASSWAPKNLNSALVMFSCRWMVNNTDRRLFTCYSDPSAGEIGTIYQACNFSYLGNNWGVKVGLMLPSGKIISKRDFTKTSAMKKWAKELGIMWQPSWCKPNGFQDLKAIPSDIYARLLERSKIEIQKYPTATQEAKGKYALILGKDRREDKKLKEFIVFKTFPYPKRTLQPAKPMVSCNEEDS